jgi:hypothetical protein
LVVAIKNNEDMVLKFDECLNVRSNFRDHQEQANEFTVQQFAELERRFLTVIQFRINPVTPLDFALLLAHRAYEPEAAQGLVFKCLPFLYCVICDL